MNAEETLKKLKEVLQQINDREMKAAIANLLLLKKQGDIATMEHIFASDKMLREYANTIFMLHGMSQGAGRSEKRVWVLRRRTTQTMLYHVEAGSVDEAINMVTHQLVEPVCEESNEFESTMLDYQDSYKLQKLVG